MNTTLHSLQTQTEILGADKALISKTSFAMKT